MNINEMFKNLLNTAVNHTNSIIGAAVGAGSGIITGTIVTKATKSPRVGITVGAAVGAGAGIITKASLDKKQVAMVPGGDIAVDVDALMGTVTGETMRDFCGSFHGRSSTINVLPKAIRKYVEEELNLTGEEAAKKIEDMEVSMIRSWLTGFGSWKLMATFLVTRRVPDELTDDDIKALLDVVFDEEALPAGVVTFIDDMIKNDAASAQGSDDGTAEAAADGQPIPTDTESEGEAASEA